jgi:predicted nucleotidyltransferase
MNFDESFGHGISRRDLAILAEVFQHYLPRLKGISIFGSRATGRFKPTSDIDLVLFGDLTFKDVARISSEMEESSISLSVDVCAYSLVDDNLKKHIDGFAKMLWSE